MMLPKMPNDQLWEEAFITHPMTFYFLILAYTLQCLYIDFIPRATLDLGHCSYGIIYSLFVPRGDSNLHHSQSYMRV